MKIFRALAVTGAIVAFCLAMLGSWTRINQAGMTCPDWPLCQGAIVPVLHGGVVDEWTHRLLAGLETFIVAALIIAGMRLRATIPALRGILVALGAVFVLQVLIGGATIFLKNSPLSVTIHWATAMLLLTTLCTLVVVAFSYDPREAPPSFGKDLIAPLFVASGWAFATMCAGAYVSSSGAGLACLDVPGCGPAFFGDTIPQALQMLHRFFAATLVVFAIAAALFLPRTFVRPRIALYVALTLMVLQITLGVLNVVLRMPTALREAHAANAVATFLSFVIATVLMSLEAGKAAVPARASSSTRVPETV